MKKRKKEKRIVCVAYLSTESDFYTVEQQEKKQLKYIIGYAKVHNIEIKKVMHRNLLGQKDVDRHFAQMIAMIKKGYVNGIILSNMLAIAANIPDAYYKVGKVVDAGGHIVTVDEGRLGMYIARGTDSWKW